MKSDGFLLIIIITTICPNHNALNSNQEPYQAGWTRVALNRDGRNFNAVIYYSSFVEGSEAQIDTIHGPYETIAFGHGFFMQNNYYIFHFKHLAQSDNSIILQNQFESLRPTGFNLIVTKNTVCQSQINFLWQSPVSCWQTIKLFDMLGKEIETIVEGFYEPGYHSTLYIINSTLPTGVYFYQLKANGFIETRKMILLR